MLKEADAVGGSGVTGNTAPVTQSINVGESANILELGLERLSTGGSKNGIALRLRTVLKKEMLCTGIKTMR